LSAYSTLISASDRAGRGDVWPTPGPTGMVAGMSIPAGFPCRSCGQWHEGLPFSYGSPAPAYWHDELAGDPNSALAEELCVIEGEHFFVRARIVIPVVDGPGEFDWGVWVSLSHENFLRTLELWETSGRESDGAVLRLAVHRDPDSTSRARST